MKKAVAAYLLIGWVLAAFTTGQIERSAFYKSLSSGEEATIDKTISMLESEKSTSRNKAYIGALTMKKAGFIKGAGAKVKTFKRGATMLEDEIRNNPTNTEYRFLRFTIQENAPGILKYNKQLNEDKQAVIAAYSQLDPSLRSVIADYAKNSKTLKSADLK